MALGEKNFLSWINESVTGVPDPRDEVIFQDARWTRRTRRSSRLSRRLDSESGQGLIEVLDQIGLLLEADRYPNQAVGDAELGSLLGRHRGVGHSRRLGDERLHAAQALGQAHHAQAAEEDLGTLVAADVEHEISAPKPEACL